MKRADDNDRIAVLGFIEEAVHVLREAPATALLVYYTGTAPFALGLLYYWSDMSRSPLADRHLLPGAFALTLLFVWMKCWQAAFASLLRSHVSREPEPRWNSARIARLIVRQLIIQPSGLFLLPIGAIILIPGAWLFAFYQNAAVLGARGDEPIRAFVGRVWREARFHPIANHVVISVLCLFGLFVAIDVAAAMVAAPMLAKMLFGVESAITLHAQSLFNTTFLAAVLAITYLLVDPLVKTAYVLRCFYGESRETGEDLRVRLRKVAAALPLILALLLAAPVTRAQEPVRTAPPAVNPTALDDSIKEVLSKPEYTWRAPRFERVKKGEPARWKFLDRLEQWGKDVANAIAKAVQRLFGGSRSTPASKFSFFSGQGLAYTLILFVIIVIGLLLYFVWRIRLKPTVAESQSLVAAAPPNLADDSVTAEQLPEDGWLQLAINLIDQGDLRLAMRAFYLASLAHLAERNLVTLAKFKSNRDYERELLKRSHALPELAALFSQNVSAFDRVWYGLHDVTAEVLQQFRGNVERIKSC